MSEKSRTQVGGSAPVDDNAWRRQWRNDLETMVDAVDEPFLSAYNTLLGELDSLSRDQAQERWQAIQQLGKEPKQ